MLCLEYLAAKMGLEVLNLASYLLKQEDMEKRQNNRFILVHSRKSKQHTLPQKLNLIYGHVQSPRVPVNFGEWGGKVHLHFIVYIQLLSVSSCHRQFAVLL